MSSIVKDELDRIKSFADSTEKRVSKLTLNELNYISDKQLHAKGGSGEDLFPEFPVIIEVDARDVSNPGDISNIHARYLKGGYSDIRESTTAGDLFIVLSKTLKSGDELPVIRDLDVVDENGVLFSSLTSDLYMLFNPDGTITFKIRNEVTKNGNI